MEVGQVWYIRDNSRTCLGVCVLMMRSEDKLGSRLKVKMKCSTLYNVYKKKITVRTRFTFGVYLLKRPVGSIGLRSSDKISSSSEHPPAIHS